MPADHPAPSLPLWRLLGWNLLAASGYFALGLAVKTFASFDDVAIPFWPAAGFALALCLVRGYGVLPGLFMGSALASSCAPAGGCGLGGLAFPVLIAAAVTVQLALSVWLLRRLGFAASPPERPTAITGFVLLVGPAGCWLPALAYWAAQLAGLVPSTTGFYGVVFWWLGDAIGSLIAFPLLLTLLARPRDSIWRQLYPLARGQLLALALLPPTSTALARSIFAGRSPSAHGAGFVLFGQYKLLLLANELLFVMLGLAFTLATATAGLNRLQLLSRSRVAAKASSAVVHEVSQPLLRLRLQLERVEQDLANLSSSPAGRLHDGVLSRVRQSIDDVVRLSLIARSIQDLTSSGVRDSQVADVKRAIDAAVAQVSTSVESADLLLEVSSHGADCLVGAGQIQLQTAFRNLLANAVRAAGPDGCVRVSFQRKVDTLRISIEDSGPGFPPQPQPQPQLLGREIVASSTGGMGIGLLIVRLVVDGSGGSLTFDRSALLGGARVTVALPIRQSGTA